MKKMQFIFVFCILLFTSHLMASDKREVSVAAGECAGLMMFAGDRSMAEVAFDRTKNFKKTKSALKRAYLGLGVLTELSANKAKIFVVGRYLRSCKKVGINAAYLFKIKPRTNIRLTAYHRKLREPVVTLIKPT